jgi:hypothetical protein
MRKLSPKTKHARLLALLIVLLVVTAVAVFIGATQSDPSDVTVNPQSSKGNSTHDEPKVSPSPSTTPGDSTPTPAPTPGNPPAKPALSKSSGNAPGSSVPPGALMEFTCQGTVGAQCQIVLTDRTNASRQITLSAKTIADNGRGQYFAAWEWAAVAGSWNVVARSTANGASVNSDAQTLEVK